MIKSSRVACALAVVLLAAGAALAQSFPDRPIRMIVPLPPASASDFLARTLGAALSDAYRQQVVVDNRPGGGGLIGSSILAKSIPDGYTLAMIAAPHVVSPLLQANPPYRPLDDVTAVAGIATIPNVVVIAPAVPARTLQEFIAFAKANPGKLNYASVGLGTLSHLAVEIFNRAAGITTVHVPFKLNSDAYAAMHASSVHYLIFTVPAATALLQGGLRGLAVTGAKRNAAYPDLPTIAEAGLPAGQSDGWWGVVGPAGMPQSVVNRLHADLGRIMRQPDMKEKFTRQGAEMMEDTSPAAFATLLRSEHTRYQQLIRAAGIKPQ